MLTVQGSWTVKWDCVAKFNNKSSVINFKAANYSALVNPEYFERYVLINKYLSYLNKRLTVKSEMEISVFMLVSITYIASGVNSGEPLLSGAPNDRFLGNDLKWLVMHPGVL